jgi:hypothetical protein
MYEKYMTHFVDQVNPFEVAAPLPDRRWRRAIDVMMGAFAVDTLDELRGAWEALHTARADQAFPKGTLAEMEQMFLAFPKSEDVASLSAELFPGFDMPGDALLGFSPEVTPEAERNPRNEDNCRRITATWSDGGVKSRLRVVYTEYFRRSYRRVVELARGGRDQ